MSRIDEALRRSGGSRPEGSGRTARNVPDLFVSPWDFEPVAGDERTSVGEASKQPSDASRTVAPRLIVTSASERFRAEWRERLVSPTTDPGLVEQFRRLAAALLDGRRDGRLKAILVTSALPGEGKTLTTLNLALVLSESYRRRVLIVDADLRRPRISEAVNIDGSDGLSEALKASEEKKVPLVQLTDNLALMPAGRPDPDPLSGLTSPRMQQLIEEAADRFDWVIIDTPPVDAAADAGLLCAMVDASVLVVKAGKTPYASVQRAVETLGRDRIFGVVLNGVNAHDAVTYGPYAAHEATAG